LSCNKGKRVSPFETTLAGFLISKTSAVMLGLPIGSLIVRVHQGTDSSIAAGALAQLSQADKQAAHPDVLDTEVPDASAFPSLGTAVELPFSSTMASLAKLMKIADELATVSPRKTFIQALITTFL